MSYWGHKERDACKRRTDYEPPLDEERQRQDLQEKLRKQFGLTFEVPIIFIDPVLKIFHPPHHNKRRSIETREEDIFKNQTSTLWKLANQMSPYECSANCKAPSRFYIGEPWITMGDEAIEEGQVNLEILCKIWDGIAAGSDKNSDEVRWTFNGEPLLIKDKKRDPIKSHTLLQTYGMEVFPPATTRGSMFAVSKVVIKQANGKKHNGNYTCSNSHGSSSWNLSKTKADMVTDTSIITEFGALGPLTESGTIIVNNVSTSCYASYPHNIAHIALLPARWWPEIFLDDESQEREGTRNYIINIKW